MDNQQASTTYSQVATKRRKPFWVTREMAEELGREEILRTTFRESVIYIVFVTLITVYALGVRNSSKYYLNKALKDLFIEKEFNTIHDASITYMDIRDITDIWYYMKTRLVESLYWEHYYESQHQLPEDDKKILFTTKMLGVPRIRQVRMKSMSCVIPTEFGEKFKKEFKSCYDEYSSELEDTASFGPGSSTAWTYSSSDITESISTSGMHHQYGGGGYFVNLADDKTATLKIIGDLMEKQWINQGTRAVFIDFLLYNANVNLFAVCKLLFEMPSTGGVIPSVQFRSIRLTRFVYAVDILRFVCECIFFIFLIMYLIEEIRDLLYFKWKYFLQGWSYIDLGIVFIGFTICGMSITKIFVLRRTLPSIKGNPKIYLSLERLAYIQEILDYFVAVELFLIYIKLFKYLNFNKTMGQLNNTLKRCAWDIVAFSVMFFVAFIAFALFGYLIFGSQVQSYSQFGSAMFTLLRTVLGDFNYQEIETVSKILAPIYFITFIFLVFFVLMVRFSSSSNKNK